MRMHSKENFWEIMRKRNKALLLEIMTCSCDSGLRQKLQKHNLEAEKRMKHESRAKNGILAIKEEAIESGMEIMFILLTGKMMAKR